MVTFIDDHRKAYGVKPICAVLPIAPSTCYARKAVKADPGRALARAQRDQFVAGRDLPGVGGELRRVRCARDTSESTICTTSIGLGRCSPYASS